VPAEADAIYIGVWMEGVGAVWVDDMEFEVW
jgi:hypothetical protein